MLSVIVLTAALWATQASPPAAADSAGGGGSAAADSDADADADADMAVNEDAEVSDVKPPSEADGEEIGAAGPSRMTESPRVRTLSQSVFVLALQSIWYWRRPSLAEAESGTTWDSWETKLFSTGEIRFDQDRYDTNAALHPIMGAVYYQIARGNGLGVGGSLLSSFLASTTWEYTT